MSEDEALSLIAAGDLRGATTWVLRAYGSEVCGYVLSLLRNEEEAADAFARASEVLFTSINRFEGRASLRTWFYGIARYTAFRYRRQAKRARGTPINDLADALEAMVRTATLEFQKSEVKDAVAGLRASLSMKERELLVLRIDRDLSWPDVAAVLLGGRESHSDAELKREAVRARKAFERAKERLRELAREAGLLG